MILITHVCVCVFIKLHITTQSGPVILVILCHSQCVCVKKRESVTRPMCSGSSRGRTYKGIDQPQHDKNRCCKPLSCGRTLCRQRAAGVCNRDEGAMVEYAQNLMRPRGSAIVTRVPWFDGRQVQKFRDFCV